MMRSREMGSAVVRFGAAIVLMFGVVVVPNSSAPAASGPPRWLVTPSSSPPGPPNGLLSAVACISPTNCFAIGRDNTQPTVVSVTINAMHRWRGHAKEQGRFRSWNGTTCATPAQCLVRKPAVANGKVTITISGPDPLLEHWNGSTWAIVPGPSAPQNGTINLIGLTCPAANSCFAVGSRQAVQGHSIVAKAAVEHWNGSTWSIVPSPSPANALAAELNAISCASPTSCIAVGDRLSGDFRHIDSIAEHAIIERFNGTSWTMVAFPKPVGSQQEFLAGVSCADASNCIASGAYLAGSHIKPLALRESGTTWSLLHAPIPPGKNIAELIDVSCTSAIACTLVGGAASGPNDADFTGLESLAERWNGTSLTTQPVPLPAGAEEGELLAVACPSASDCSAVGLVGLPDGNVAAQNVHWDGLNWSVASSPASTPFFELVEIACTSTSQCFAAGNSAIVEQWNGTAWSLSPFYAKTSQSVLDDVACPGETSCLAVGSYADNTGGPKPLAERFDGSRWRVTAPPPIPAGQPNAELVSVACVSATNCTAVGGAGDFGPVATLVEHWDGASWSIVPSPTPPGGVAVELIDVSCGGPQRCNALGVVVGSDDSERAFAEHGDGSSWNVDPLPVSVFADFVQLQSLSCVTPVSCFAVGAYEVVTGSRQLIVRTLLLHWNGSQWRPMALPKIPGDPEFVVLNIVSCSGPNQCLAIGFSSGSNLFGGGPLNLRWDGKRWSAVANGGSPNLETTGLSCRSEVSCYAVGAGFSRDEFGATPGVAHWGGRHWRRSSVQSPSGAHQAFVGGVDCPSRRVCFAVGAYENVLGSFTLVLRGT